MLADVPIVSPSVEVLLAGAERREPFENPDGRSTARFERVWIDGRAHILKHIHPDDDFTMRVSGDDDCRTVRAWSAGLLDAAPDLVDHAIVGAVAGTGRDALGGALLMRDVSDELLPAGDSEIPAAQHAAFLDDIAGFCAATWGWHDDPGTGPRLLPFAARWEWFGHRAIESERKLGFPEPVPKIAAEGWERFAQRAPTRLAAIIDDLRHDVRPLAEALRSTPSCLLHGDVKASNAGRGRDGRTVLVDWAYVGEGPAAHELAWHLALDRARLPVSKERTIELFRDALERHGVATAGWWGRQLSLCLLGALVQFGWEKALGDDDELAWWCAAATEGTTWL